MRRTSSRHRSLQTLPLGGSGLFRIILLLLILTVAGCRPEESRRVEGGGSGHTESSATLPGGEAESGSIRVSQAWARPAAEGGMSAAYMILSNSGEEEETLETVSSDAAQMVEIHESFEQEGGMVGMREIGRVHLPPGGAFELRPGGVHIMLMHLTSDLNAGDRIDLTLHFARAGTLSLSVPVRGGASSSHDAHHSSSEDHSH